MSFAKKFSLDSIRIQKLQGEDGYDATFETKLNIVRCIQVSLKFVKFISILVMAYLPLSFTRLIVFMDRFTNKKSFYLITQWINWFVHGPIYKKHA